MFAGVLVCVCVCVCVCVFVRACVCVCVFVCRLPVIIANVSHRLVEGPEWRVIPF